MITTATEPAPAAAEPADESRSPALEDLDALVEYLIWLRTATPADVAKLDE